jgi:hypothetical protein
LEKGLDRRVWRNKIPNKIVKRCRVQ